MKIAQFGTFDVDNYGDLLFPYIARYRLSGYELVHVSPTNSKTSFLDSLPVISYKQSLNEKFDAVLVGGGNIIHAGNTLLNNYKNVSGFAYPYLWMGAARIANKQKIPLIFNAPGIMSTYHGLIERKLYKEVFSLSSYLSFREYESAQIASSIILKNIEIVPDTAFDISNMWPIDGDEKGKYIIVNLNQRYHQPIKNTVEFLLKLKKRLNQPIKLIIIGGCHGDHEFARNVQKEAKGEVEIIETMSIKSMAHLIGKASYFLGSSLHGFITALTYGTPALLVLNDKPMKKFTGLISLLKLPVNSICYSWEDAFKRLDYPVLITLKNKEDIKVKLDNHWQKINECILAGQASKPSLIIDNWKTLLLINRSFYKVKSIIKIKYRA